MEIIRKNDKKILEIWLTNAEKNDVAIRESLKSLYKKYQAQKFTVAVFESGPEDLYEGTKQLLIQNIHLT